MPRAIALSLLIFFSLALQGDLPGKANSPSGIAAPYIFSVTRWEAQNLPKKWGYEIKQVFSRTDLPGEGEVGLVRDYFLLGQRIKELEYELVRGSSGGGQSDGEGIVQQLAAARSERAKIEELMEAIVERQISHLLAGEGLFWRVKGKRGFFFPPLDFEPTELPYILVVSPRHKIELAEKILLEPTLTLKEIVDVEERVEKLGVSAMIERVGGVATYPSMVSETASLNFTLSTIAHEWMHHYLLFHPLGRSYGASYEMTVINETVANMVGDEISSLAQRIYYGEGVKVAGREKGGFDFEREMRAIRSAVDQYLAEGEIEKAEGFMEEERCLLMEHGYFIRRLNQAYFAFHGTYADTPASTSPIGGQLKTLRERSDSLGEFVRTVARISTYEDLKKLLQ